MDQCSFSGCQNAVSKPGHTLCYAHWKTSNPEAAPRKAQRVLPQPRTDATLSATALGERLQLPSHKVNQILAELGWISREKKGWIATAQGVALGALKKEHYQTGVPYVLWPETILSNKALSATIKSVTGESEQTPAPAAVTETTFRERFAATHRTTDGHWVRSKAEMLIDNWLYMAGIAHAYERQLPIEEELYCDFYIPEGKVYIEYWGLESDPKYASRKKTKLELYQKYNFNLIQLSDEHIRNLDDYLPKFLLRFNVIVN